MKNLFNTLNPFRNKEKSAFARKVAIDEKRSRVKTVLLAKLNKDFRTDAISRYIDLCSTIGINLKVKDEADKYIIIDDVASESTSELIKLFDAKLGSRDNVILFINPPALGKVVIYDSNKKVTNVIDANSGSGTAGPIIVKAGIDSAYIQGEYNV